MRKREKSRVNIGASFGLGKKEKKERDRGIWRVWARERERKSIILRESKMLRRERDGERERESEEERERERL